jgi:RimJ/RimL family protein N-acetyltransferase
VRFLRFGATLERLGHEHLEMVRQWRNSHWVRPYMRYQEFIRPEDQPRWFQGLDARSDWYFIAHRTDAPFALFNIKAVDWTRQCGEAGGFVGDPGFIGRPEPGLATLALMDFAFFVLRLESLEAHYDARWVPIARFNEQIGYRLFREEADGFVRANVTAGHYRTCASALRKAAATLHGWDAILIDADSWLTERVRGGDSAALPDFELQLR